MIEEHCNVVLTQDIDAAGLRAGDIGTIVMVHAKGAAYEVELMTLGEQPTRLRILEGESPSTVSCPKRTVSISAARGGNELRYARK